MAKKNASRKTTKQNPQNGNGRTIISLDGRGIAFEPGDDLATKIEKQRVFMAAYWKFLLTVRYYCQYWAAKAQPSGEEEWRTFWEMVGTAEQIEDEYCSPGDLKLLTAVFDSPEDLDDDECYRTDRTLQAAFFGEILNVPEAEILEEARKNVGHKEYKRMQKEVNPLRHDATMREFELRRSVKGQD